MSLVVMSIVANIVCECTISEASMLMLVDLLVFLQSLGVLLLLLLLLLLSLCCCFWFTFSSFFFAFLTDFVNSSSNIQFFV